MSRSVLNRVAGDNAGCHDDLVQGLIVRQSTSSRRRGLLFPRRKAEGRAFRSLNGRSIELLGGDAAATALRGDGLAYKLKLLHHFSLLMTSSATSPLPGRCPENGVPPDTLTR